MARANVEKATTAVVISVAMYTFTSTVNLLPALPFLPLAIAIVLGVITIYRGPVGPAGALSLIVFVAIIYQLTGFAIWTAPNPVAVILIVATSAALLVTFTSALREATSMAIAVIAVAAMFTPYYYISVALITVAAVSSPVRKMWPMVATYILTLAPLLVVENSLEPRTGNGPMIFAQLSNLDSNMRPPLTSINIFLPGSSDAAYINPKLASEVLSYFASGEVYQLIVPLVTLVVVFSLSAVAAEAVNGALRRLASALPNGEQLGRGTPVIVSLVGPIVFIAGIVALSLHALGGYRTEFGLWDASGLVASSILLGAIFTAKEQVTLFLERTELTKVRLRTAVRELLEVTAENSRLVTYIGERAPSVDIGFEAKSNHEAAIAVKDIETGIEAMKEIVLEQWTSEVEALTKKAKGLPESMRLKLASSVNTITTYRITLSNALREAGVEVPIGTSTIDVSTIDTSIASYDRVAADARRDAIRLLDAFEEAQAAYHTLTDKPTSQIPVNPLTLFDSHDERAGLRLVAEEYILRFQNGNQQELEHLMKMLTTSYGIYAKAGGYTDPETLAIFESIRPMDAPKILCTINEIKSSVDATLQNIVDEEMRLSDYLDDLVPGSWELLDIDPTPERSKVESILTNNMGRLTTLANLTSMLDDVAVLLKRWKEEKRRNEEAIIVIIQYAYAKREIEGRLQDGKRVRLSDLPYTPSAAHLFAQLYTQEKHSTNYNEDEEEITLG